MSVELKGIKVNDVTYDMVSMSDLQAYLAKTDASDTYATKTSLSSYVTKEALNNYVLQTSLGTAATKNITISTSDPTGGSNGDIWIKYTA